MLHHEYTTDYLTMMLRYRDCYLLESTVVRMDGHRSDVITDVTSET